MTPLTTLFIFSVIRAETLMVNFLVEHNLPFLSADHLLNLEFPDSKIVATEFASKRTRPRPRSQSTAIARTLGQEAKVDLCIIN